MVVRRIWDAEVVGSNPATLISIRLRILRLHRLVDLVEEIVQEVVVGVE